MANAFYNKGRENAWTGDIDWDGTAYRANLISTGYSVDLNLHEDFADVSASEITTNPHGAALTSKTNVDGVADAADQTPAFTGPNNGGTAADYLIFAKGTDVDANDHLLLYIDTAAAGLPVTPNGGNLNLSFNASGIATLGATS